MVTSNQKRIQTTQVVSAKVEASDPGYLELKNIFESISGIKKVYFEPPPGIKMVYPCVRFQRVGFDSKFADNIPYKIDDRYEATLMYTNPDSSLPARFARLPLCRHNRHYTANGISHDVYIIYPQGGIKYGKN